MQTRFFTFAALMILLASCAPATLPAPTATPVPPTSTAIPPTVTATPESILATPLPIQPSAPAYVLTPNALQVASWQEYQAKLREVILADYGPSWYGSALCEWDILGQSGQDVYVWAYCAFDPGSSRAPAIIHLDKNGSIQNVEAPRSGPEVTSDIQRMFPADVREKLLLYYSPPSPNMGRAEVLGLHLIYRETHPDVPPLSVLSATYHHK